MAFTRFQGLMLAAIIATGALVAPAFAASTVNVELWDKGADTEMPTNLLYGTAGVDLSTATMGVKTDVPSTAAGEVTFKVTNTSKDTIHEMIVIQLAEPGKPLPYITDESRVDEDKAGDKGEVSELDPGASGALTVTLQPGKYLLICNVPGHFAAGMWTEFEVTK